MPEELGEPDDVLGCLKVLSELKASPDTGGTGCFQRLLRRSMEAERTERITTIPAEPMMPAELASFEDLFGGVRISKTPKALAMFKHRQVPKISSDVCGSQRGFEH
jgi:hypothetical protein